MSTEDPLWPPRVGELLPRATSAYKAPEKIEWLLSEEGHGREWARVLHIGPADTERFWEAIRQAVIYATILAIRDISPYGINCDVPIQLTIGGRTATTTTVWHYVRQGEAPRLVTAYPNP